MAKLKDILKSVETIQQQALRLAANKIVNESFSFIPVYSGDLRDAVKNGITVNKDGAEIRVRKSDIPYARRHYYC